MLITVRSQTFFARQQLSAFAKLAGSSLYFCTTKNKGVFPNELSSERKIIDCIRAVIKGHL